MTSVSQAEEVSNPDNVPELSTTFLGHETPGHYLSGRGPEGGRAREPRPPPPLVKILLFLSCDLPGWDDRLFNYVVLLLGFLAVGWLEQQPTGLTGSTHGCNQIEP